MSWNQTRLSHWQCTLTSGTVLSVPINHEHPNWRILLIFLYWTVTKYTCYDKHVCMYVCMCVYVCIYIYIYIYHVGLYFLWHVSSLIDPSSGRYNSGNYSAQDIWLYIFIRECNYSNFQVKYMAVLYTDRLVSHWSFVCMYVYTCIYIYICVYINN
jgi:hypothetical protein